LSWLREGRQGWSKGGRAEGGEGWMDASHPPQPLMSRQSGHREEKAGRNAEVSIALLLKIK